MQDLIADNCIAEISQFDPQVLISLIEELEAGGLDMELTGFDASDLERFKLEYGIPDIEFPEFTEEIAKDVKKIVCPHCGKDLLFKVVSTFAGCGGSSLGYKRAGPT